MTDYPDYIYCSPFLPVQSLDALLSNPDAKLGEFRDPAESPEDALIKKRDVDRLHHWLTRLHPRLAVVAKLLMAGQTQAAIARKLHLTEAAISKRIARIRQQGLSDLFDLRESPLLQ